VKLTDQAAAGKDTLRSVRHDVAGNGVTKARANEERQKMETLIQDRTLKRDNLMAKVVDPNNLNDAYRRVTSNKGAAGIDGMTTKELTEWLRINKEQLIKELLDGTYKPQPVRRKNIPKSNGSTRKLGIPTVVDRLVQQALLQVLTPIIDPTFSESSYGFRPNRSAHQALLKAKEYVASGKEIVVDVDLVQFFDRVNHDILMSRLARHIGDKEILKLARKYLQAGVLENGVCIRSEEGTPQGGPLSPLLANIMLDDLDKELEKRGHAFCRYADDCNIYVNSIAAGQRVMNSITTFLAKRLRLTVNQEKSAVAPSSEPNILGISSEQLWDIAYSRKEPDKSQKRDKRNNSPK
jgi:RNA-directed DNA polymerase